MGYNSQQKLRDNIEAIQTALEWKPGALITNEQAGVLKKYSGFGGLKAVLFPNAAKEEWIKLNKIIPAHHAVMIRIMNTIFASRRAYVEVPQPNKPNFHIS